jgi:hypothetical protein
MSAQVRDPQPSSGADRRLLIGSSWSITWLLLLAELWAPLPAHALALVAVCVGQLALFAGLERGRLSAMSVQVRIAFGLLVCTALFVPGLHGLLYLPLVGVAARLSTGYCLLARLVWLLPWNRQQPLSGRLLRRTLLSAPVVGPFSLPAQAELV